MGEPLFAIEHFFEIFINLKRIFEKNNHVDVKYRSLDSNSLCAATLHIIAGGAIPASRHKL